MRRGALPTPEVYDEIVPSNGSFIPSPSMSLGSSPADPLSLFYIGVQMKEGVYTDMQAADFEIRAINL